MKKHFERFAAAAIGALFVYAGVLKVINPAAFAMDVFNYRLLPWPLAAAAALYLPWLEILCGGALIVRRGFRGALWLTTALMVIFTAALLLASARGLDIECGCFGHADQAGAAWPLARDGALLVVLLALVWRDWLAGRRGAA